MHIKSLTTLILFMLVAMNAIYGQEATPDWENPEVFAVNLERQGLRLYLMLITKQLFRINMRNPLIINL